MFAIFPEILQLVQKGDLETLACSVRKYFGARTTYSPRLDVEGLLTQMGIRVEREKGPGIGRVRAFDAKGQYSVVLSLNVSIQDVREKNFTLAHLLGYFLFAIQPSMARADLSSELYQLEGDLYEFSAATGGQKQQRKSARLQEADLFALALLLPQGMVKKAHQRFNGVDGPTAAFFNVSPLVMKQRLQQLGMGPKRVQNPPPKTPRAAPARSERPQPNPELSPAKPLASSLERAQKSLVSMSYRREESRSSKLEAPADDKLTASSSASASKAKTREPQNEGSNQGLQRLRELAKKIDRSVDV